MPIQEGLNDEIYKYRSIFNFFDMYRSFLRNGKGERQCNFKREFCHD